MTSYASLRSAVDAMKLGAVDYIAKPFDHDEMIASVQKILSSTTPETTETTRSTPENTMAGQIFGSCPAMKELFRRISKVARTPATVLIQGESGTGKELAARAIHEQSDRAGTPMISVNCAAIPESLIESELFGHEKAPLPARQPDAAVCWKPPMAAPCSSTRSANCHWKLRPGCCDFCRRVRSVGWARYNRRRSMYV